MNTLYVFCLISLLTLTQVRLSCQTEQEENIKDMENENDTENVSDGGPDEIDGVRVEDNVLVLNPDNFDEVVEKYETVLVEFYAPWCGHCKNLAPEYSAAAAVLKDNDPPIMLAKVDATVHQELGQRFEVSGYPTLFFFKKGTHYQFDGPRNKDGIVTFMKDRARPDWAPEPDAVIDLTKENFHETIKKEALILVEFYAPWCGHCKRLAPVYEKAAKTLKREDPPIVLAKVDATKETSLAEEYGVSGYPTLKFFKKGRMFEYKGKRDQEYDIVEYMLKYKSDGATLMENPKAIKTAMNSYDTLVVGFFESESAPGILSYKDAADELREEFNLGITYSADARKQYKVNPGTVVFFNAERFYTKFEPKWYMFDVKADTTSDVVMKFIKKHQFPLVGHYTYGTTDRYDALRPLCLFFYSVDFGHDHKEATQLWRNKIAVIANKNKDITFAVADDVDHATKLEEFGLGDSGEEMNVGIVGADGRKYGMEPMEEFDSELIEEFISDYRQGKLKAKVKSQRAPKKQSGPVTVVVGDTFEKIVMDTSKDVLIELYAPWCGHCKKLEPIYEALAKKLKNEKNLVIAKMDATANDAPDTYSSSGFPTIYFAPSNRKDKPIKYDEGRTKDEIEKFLKEKATVSFGKSAKTEL